MPGLETVSMGIWNAVGGRDEIESINELRTFWNTWHLKVQQLRMHFK